MVQLQTLGGQAGVVYGDVTLADSAPHLVEDARATLHGLDVLVYAASGPFAPVSPEKLAEADWDRSFDVIAKGFFLTARAAHHVFAAFAGRDAAETQATRGAIVALTDPLADKPSAAFTAHAAAKAAQVSLVKSLAVAWADDRVRVCGIHPGRSICRRTRVAQAHCGRQSAPPSSGWSSPTKSGKPCASASRTTT